MAKQISRIDPITRPGLSITPTSYMNVAFTYQQMMDILSDPPGVPILIGQNSGTLIREITVGILVREQKPDEIGNVTLEILKVKMSALYIPNIAIDLPNLTELSMNQNVHTVIGKSDKKTPSPKFKELDKMGFCYFDKPTILKMLNFKNGQNDLTFKRVRVEMDSQPKPFQTLTVEPSPFNTITDGDLGQQPGSISHNYSYNGNGERQELITFAFGYGCPPTWPPDNVIGPNVNVVPDDLPFNT